MIAYFDSSLLIKLVADENRSAEARAFALRAAGAASAAVSRVEVAATLARALRSGRMTAAESRLAQTDCEHRWRRLTTIMVDAALIQRAVEVAWGHGLRGYDAVQLAAALHFQAELAEAVTFATFDRELAAAAAAAGLEVWPPDMLPAHTPHSAG